MVVPTRAGIRPARPGEHDLRLAWISVALIPVAFILAMLAGEGLIAALGYDPGTEDIPAWAAVLAGTPALLILVAPGAAAVGYGRRAYAAGRTSARWAVWLGGAAAILSFTVNVLAFTAGR